MRTVGVSTDGHGRDPAGTAANQRITEALGIGDAEPDPGDEDDDDTEQAS